MRAVTLSPLLALAALLLSGATQSGCIPDVTARCEGVAPTCGATGAENCCSPGQMVKGGKFQRDNDPDRSATVADFYLDRYEVTVGRFRQFVAAYPESKPKAGDGAHPGVDKSGWDDGWNKHLPADATALKKSLGCDPNFRTWTDAAGSNETLPINCVSWYVAFSFCGWDGGRLPTEAEWSYATAGGNSQNKYPWGSAPPPDAAHGAFGCNAKMGGCSFSDIHPVGATPAGDGRFGQSDLAGNMTEWVADRFGLLPASCGVDDCLALDPAAAGRPARGGDFANDVSFSTLTATSHDMTSQPPDTTADYLGFRCARDAR